MPVLPLVGSMMRAPGSSCASSSIAFATRSLIEPVGFWPSSFAYRRTDGFGASRCNSTSGVFPIRSRRLPAVLLRTTFPDVDRGAGLSEQLIDTPDESTPGCRDGSVAVVLDEVASSQARELQEVLSRPPRLVLDHPLAPLRSEPLDGAENEPRRAGRRFDLLRIERSDRRGVDELR